MSFLKFLKSNLGISMVEVTLAVGILGIGGVALMTLTKNTAKDSRSIDLSAIRSQYYHSLKEFIHSRNACELLKSHTLQIDSTPLNLQSELLPIIKREKYFELKSIKARLMAESQLAGFLNDSEASVEIAVSIGPSQSSSSGTGSTSVASNLETFYFLIPVIIDGANKIKYCDIEKSKELACRSESGTLENGVCKIKENCKLTGSFSIICGYQGFSTPLANPLTGASSCPAGSVPKKSSEFLYKEKQPPSKKGSTSPLVGTMIFYICLECPVGTVIGDSATCPGSGGGGGGGGWFGGGGSGP